MVVESEPRPPTGNFGIGSGPILYQSAFLAHQLPLLAPFKGDVGPNTETIDEWLERFEMLSAECRWTARAKLFHLTSRLERQAYSFYRLCTPQIKGSFELLAAELRNRFTPVRLQGVDTSLFHQRKQRSGEMVDEYAEDVSIRKHTLKALEEVTVRRKWGNLS